MSTQRSARAKKILLRKIKNSSRCLRVVVPCSLELNLILKFIELVMHSFHRTFRGCIWLRLCCDSRESALSVQSASSTCSSPIVCETGCSIWVSFFFCSGLRRLIFQVAPKLRQPSVDPTQPQKHTFKTKSTSFMNIQTTKTLNQS